MKTRRLRRSTIWWNAVRDRRHNLPAANATALGAMEQRIQAAVNLSVRSLQAQYVKATEGLKALLVAATDSLQRDDRPEFERLVKKTGRRQERVSLQPSSHRVLMATFFLGEAAFNVIVFAVFRENMLFSILMALGVAVGIPLVAYKTGVALRQYEPAMRKVLWVAAGCLIAAVTLGGINWIRVTYLRATAHSVEQGGFLSLSYFLINLSIFAAATFVTYLAKDPEEGFVEAKERVQAREGQIAELRGRLNELATQLVHDVQVLHESGHQAIAYYRGVNRRGRTELPAYFDSESASNHRVKFVDVTPERFDEAIEPVTPTEVPREAKPVVRIRGIV